MPPLRRFVAHLIFLRIICGMSLLLAGVRPGVL
jgi:hypothetical protein